jgi:hypothetical protein
MYEELKKFLDSYLQSKGIQLTEEEYKTVLTLIEDDIRNTLNEFLISHYVHEVISNA